MTDIMTFLLSLVGFAFLLVAMSRHQQAWLQRRLSPSLCRAVRLSGFTALALAFAIAVAGLGWGYGAVTWFGWTTIAAALVVAANVYRERGTSRARC
ncbi:DUF3325 domain-containing protein [Sphingomonas sp. RS6]